MEIIFQIDESFLAGVQPEPIEKALATVLALVSRVSNLPAAPTITVVITDNETVRQLNDQYLGIDAPTDVLSFENTPDPDFPGVEQVGPDYLGDIVIAYPMAETQALTRGHTPLDEIRLLAVHGLLHLLGFDHDTPKNKDDMWAIQQQIMAELGLAHIQPTET